MKIRKEDIEPLCPHCERALESVVQVKRGFFGINRMFCCPHCRKVLGMTAGSG